MRYASGVSAIDEISQQVGQISDEDF